MPNDSSITDLLDIQAPDATPLVSADMIVLPVIVAGSPLFLGAARLSYQQAATDEDFGRSADCQANSGRGTLLCETQHSARNYYVGFPPRRAEKE
jgi:hypothetical protein